MEKSRSEILSEIQDTLAALKARIAEVENKLAELEQLAPDAEEEVTVGETVTEPVPESVDVPAEVPAEEPVTEPVEEPVPESEEEPVTEPEEKPEAAEDLNPIDISIDDDELEAPSFAEPEEDDLPEPGPEPVREPAPAPQPVGSLLDDEMPEEPKVSINDRQERNVKKAVMDVMGQKLAWKTAIPGTPVKNVISAISLNDRVLFINTLFKEDPMAFQNAIAAFNSMSSFAEAEEYVRTNHPDWKLNSDLVFRLMMAVRRKLR